MIIKCFIFEVDTSFQQKKHDTSIMLDLDDVDIVIQSTWKIDESSNVWVSFCKRMV